MKHAFPVHNPFSREMVAEVPIFSDREVDAALGRAHAYRPALSAAERARILDATAVRLEHDQEEIARLISSESGLSLKDTGHEVARAAQAARFAGRVAGIVEQDTTARYEIFPKEKAPKLSVITEPLDLIAAVTPFNHPLNQVAHKIFPAVAAGACIVVKPSSKTPLAAMKLREILTAAGLPEEMFQLITGVPARDLVRRMATDPRVDLVTFTGGWDAGRDIAAAMADSKNILKRFVPELGGCSSLIVHEDADLGRAVEVALTGCFANSGQRCTAVRRIVAVGNIADRFVEALTEGVRKLRFGNPFDPANDMGTLISEAAALEVENRVKAAIEEGARLCLGNMREGALLAPTVLDQVSLSSRLVAEETFGPVAPVLRVADIEAAIRVANQTPYRLAGAIMTRDRNLAERVSRALEVGQFNWNGPPGYRTEAAPFGGFGASGNGSKEGILLAAEGMRRIRTFYEHRF